LRDRDVEAETGLSEVENDLDLFRNSRDRSALLTTKVASLAPSDRDVPELDV
jgi:hypothetical protein